MNHHANTNESIRLFVAQALEVDTRCALAAFCRRNGFPHIFNEVIGPLLNHSQLVFSFAALDRPWPPKGIGSQTVAAFAVAMIGHERRAHLTPVILDRGHATNLGLASAVTKQLLDALQKQEVSACGYIIRQGEPALERALERASFARADLHVATEFAEYIEYSTQPAKALDALGLAGMRVGELMAGSLKPNEIDILGAYHFTLGAALAAFLHDEPRSAALLAGLIDLVASLPPGGVPPGTAGPRLAGGGGPVER
jgi:hypothetical protein